jgi:streptogramin lyase
MGTRARVLVLLFAASTGLSLIAATASAEGDLPVDLAVLEEVVPEGWVWDDFLTGYFAPELGIKTVDPPLTEYTLPPNLAAPHGVSKEPGNTSATQSSGPNVWFSTLGEPGLPAPNVVRLDPQTGALTVFTVPATVFGTPVAVLDLFVQPDKVVWGEATMGGEDMGDLFFVDPKTNTGRIYDTNIRLPDQMSIDQQGNIWGVESVGLNVSRIWVFNQKKGQLFKWDVSPFGRLPRSIVRRRNGDVWFNFRRPAVGQIVGRIGRLDPKTNAFTFYTAGQTPLVGFERMETIKAEPNDAMGAPDGRVWVTPGFEDVDMIEAVGVLDPATLTFTRYNVPTPNANPYGLAMGCAGSVAFGENNGNTARKLGLLVPGQSTPDGVQISTPTTAVITPVVSTPPSLDLVFTPLTQQSMVTTTQVVGTVVDGIAEFQTNAAGDQGPHLTVIGPNERIVASLPNPATNTYRIALLELPPGMRCNKAP